MKSPINKVLAFFTIALLITNVVLVFFLWKNKKQHSYNKDRGNRGDWMVNELKFDDKQKEAHKKMKEAHFASLKPVFDSITSYRSSLYSLLKDSVTNDSLASYYIKSIGEKNSLVSQYTFGHFKKLRAICNPGEQQNRFDSVVQKIVKNLGGKEARPKSERK
jgi:periplasmic protein CpxP/Spy